MRIDIWSDVNCPWCYIGKRRFEQALADFPHRDEVEVTWRAFELDASAPRSYDGQGTYAERLARKYGRTVAEAQSMMDSMTASAAEEGLTFDFSIARPGNTFDAHRLLHLAAERGVQDAVKERFLRATFTEGEPIGDPETLVRLAAEAGLDADEAREVLGSDRFALDVRGDERQAQAYGITGVPFFVVDGTYGVSGAQPAELLREVLDKAWGDAHPQPLVSVGQPAGGHGPGCDGDSCSV